MKKLLALLFVLVFAVSASAAVVDFSECRIKVDVPEGWTHTATGPSVTLVGPDNTCAIALVKSTAGGISAEEAAKQMAAANKGAEPQKIDDTTYQYTFKTENSVETVVTVGVENDTLMVASVTGQHADVEKILGSIEDY